MPPDETKESFISIFKYFILSDFDIEIFKQILFLERQ